MFKKNKNIPTIEKNKIQLNRLYKCRDFEISTLWQRSIFLTTFLIALYTGYGALLLKAIDINYFRTLYNESIRLFLFITLIFIVISLLGCLVSTLWVIMAKGSKFWYEYYEHLINNKEIDLGISTQNIDNNIQSYDNSIYLLKAGRYSPSKINIIIGLISLCAWFIIYLSHLTFLCIFISDNKCILFVFFILLLFVLEIIILNSCKSS